MHVHDTHTTFDTMDIFFNLTSPAPRALAFACLDFEATDAQLDAWFAASVAQRRAAADASALVARHLGATVVGFSPSSEDIAYDCASRGHLRCLRWALAKMSASPPPRSIFTSYICLSAAQNGHLACLQYAHAHGCFLDTNTPFYCMHAALGGHLACLQYLHEHGCVWDKHTCANAALGGHLACLQYAHEHGCVWDKGTCAFAARNGRLACLQYAHEHGCPWETDYTCMYAALGGHLACLVYAHEHGCPWDAETCIDAALLGYLDNYAAQSTSSTYDKACWRRRRPVFAAMNWHLACLAYIRGGLAPPP